MCLLCAQIKFSGNLVGSVANKPETIRTQMNETLRG